MNNLTRIIRYNKPSPKIIPRISAIMLNTIICVWLIFAFPLSVYASDHGGGGSTSEPTSNWTDEQKSDYFRTNFSRLVARAVGVIRGSDSADSVFNSFKNLYYTNTIQQNMSWEQWLAQDLGWSFDDKGNPTITLSVNCLNAMQQAVDQYINSQPYYTGYTYDITKYSNSFDDKSIFDKMVDICKSNNYVSIVLGAKYYRVYNDCYFVVDSSKPSSLSKHYPIILYDSKFNYISSSSYLNCSDDSSINLNTDLVYLSKKDTININAVSGYPLIFTYGRKPIKIYPSLDAFKADSVGSQTYYITYDYSKGATFSSPKTFSNETIQNTISYETVQNFNQQYYDQHNTTANYETINNYITNYYETINNNGGSGGGGSGDSGGGIFDWLGSVGEILGSLIKALGEIVVGLLDGIASVITSFIDTLPTQVNNLFGTLFDWLPPEIRSLIVLSITLSLIWGIIKLIRG